MPTRQTVKLMRRREVPDGLRFITFSCDRRRPFLLQEDACHAFLDALSKAQRKHGLAIHAWVLMPEHVHLLCRPGPNVPLARTLMCIKVSVAKRTLGHASDSALDPSPEPPTERRFWQRGGGFDRNVRDMAEFCREIKYIHRNPVERKLVTRSEDWMWSSVRWWMGLRDGEFPCDPPPGNPDSWKSWKGFV
jgi:putative transposase